VCGNRFIVASFSLIQDNSHMTKRFDSIRPIRWENDQLVLLDQRLLPQQEIELSFNDVHSVARAITDMVVRGAPAIGITAAYGIVIAARAQYVRSSKNWKQDIKADLDILAAARPTAVNLFWAIKRMSRVIDSISGVPVDTLLHEAHAILHEDIEANYKMGELGASMLNDNSKIITHCNAGALATGGYGTALGVIRAAHGQGKIEQVYADETRPWMQGVRLTAWELQKEGIPVKLIAEGAAAMLMRQEKPDWVIVGSDRIAANGDVANKIGTYSLAVNAKRHGVKFMVAAPTSTIDMETTCGDDIPIEYRSEKELLNFAGINLAPAGVHAWNPVFDVTPAELVDVIVTERGIVEKPDSNKIAVLMSAK
jgi:methylthioribose-1-phosphate isomerase